VKEKTGGAGEGPFIVFEEGHHLGEQLLVSANAVLLEKEKRG